MPWRPRPEATRWAPRSPARILGPVGRGVRRLLRPVDARRACRARAGAVPAHAARGRWTKFVELTQTALRRLHAAAAPAVELRALRRRASRWPRSIGVPLGLLMGWFRWLDDVVTPLFDGAALRRADRVGAVRGAVVRHRHRRPGADHLQRRVSAVPDQRLSRRAVRRDALHRGGADAGREQLARHLRGAAAGFGAVDRRRRAHQRGARAGSR